MIESMAILMGPSTLTGSWVFEIAKASIMSTSGMMSGSNQLTARTRLQRRLGKHSGEQLRVKDAVALGSCCASPKYHTHQSACIFYDISEACRALSSCYFCSSLVFFDLAATSFWKIWL